MAKEVEMIRKINKQPESKIPVLSPAPLRRSGSMRLGDCPPIQEHNSNVNLRPRLNRHRSLQSLNTASSFVNEQDDDVDSVRSFSSTASVCSNVSQCDHAHFARNGTTYSGRCKRYVVHCSPHSTETDDYLTPTQRTNRTIRKLRTLLKDAQAELAEKDKEILRLTKEVVELRLLKVDSGTESNEVDGENLDLSQRPLARSENHLTRSDQLSISPHLRFCPSPPLAQSLSDSGHFEDLNSSKEVSQATLTHINNIKTVESVRRQHEDEIRELKEKHNEKVDSLLQRITDVNDRYYALRPLYEDCKERLHELEKENEEIKSGSSQSNAIKISELELVNLELLHEKDFLTVEVNRIKELNKELELCKLNYERLEVENVLLKNSEVELIKSLNSMKDEKCKNCFKSNSIFLDHGSQTENVKSVHSTDGHCQTINDGCDQNHLCSYKTENSELQIQISTTKEKIRQLEEYQSNEKGLYLELYKKGMEAAKLMDGKEIENGQTEEKESSLIPNLLQKLRIKQEELDNIKAMYRRLLETKKCQPKHDPEMTLQFLKSAFYYFLTDRENAQGHLSAIESILGFSDNEKINIDKAFLWR